MTLYACVPVYEQAHNYNLCFSVLMQPSLCIVYHFTVLPNYSPQGQQLVSFWLLTWQCNNRRLCKI